MSEPSETIFSEGFIFKRPKEGSPAFVKGSLSLNVYEATAFMQKHSKGGWVNLDLLASKDNTKLYFKLNTWEKPVDNAQPPVAQQVPAGEQPPAPQKTESTIPEYPEDEIKPEDIPF